MTKKFLKKKLKPAFPETVRLLSKTTRMQCADQYDPHGSLVHLLENYRSGGTWRGCLFTRRHAQKIQRVSVKKMFPYRNKRIHLLSKVDVMHFAAVSGKPLACRKEALEFIARQRTSKSKTIKDHRLKQRAAGFDQSHTR